MDALRKNPHKLEAHDCYRQEEQHPHRGETPRKNESTSMKGIPALPNPTGRCLSGGGYELLLTVIFSFFFQLDQQSHI